MAHGRWSNDITERAALHAALGDPARLAVVEQLLRSDRSPTELSHLMGITSNLLAHHLDVLEGVDLIGRTVSAGDQRRRYVHVTHTARSLMASTPLPTPRSVLFVCTRNSARSQLAATLWRARVGRPARSAGTDPAPTIDTGAIDAAVRAGYAAPTSRPARLGRVGAHTQVVTVCDLAHEEVGTDPRWWHWSIPDPVRSGSAAAFDDVIAELDRRIAIFTPSLPDEPRKQP